MKMCDTYGHGFDNYRISGLGLGLEERRLGLELDFISAVVGIKSRPLEIHRLVHKVRSIVFFSMEIFSTIELRSRLSSDMGEAVFTRLKQN